MEELSDPNAIFSAKEGKVCDNYTFSPVNVSFKESTGIIFLGLLSLFLFFALRRLQKRYDALVDQKLQAPETE